jgi:hypothetical protein
VQCEARDFLAADAPLVYETHGKLAADHSGRAEDQDMHEKPIP